MRTFVLAICAAIIASMGLALPTSTPAHAAKIIIKRGGHDRDYSWRHHHDRKVLIIKRGRHHDY